MKRLIIFSIVGGVFFFGSIYLQLSSLNIANVEFLSLGGILISILFGIYALTESARSTKQFDEHLDELKTIEQNLKTRHINTFPENFSDLDKLFDLCLDLKKANKNIKLEIFTDYVGYGAFSKNSAFIDYEKRIEKLWKNKIKVTWNFYNEKYKNWALAEQFDTYDEKQIKEYILKSKKHVKEPCDDADTCPIPNNKECENCDRKIITGLDENHTTKDKLVEALKLILDTKENNILEKKGFANLIAKPNNCTFNYFGWFVFANNELKRAIISYPNYELSNESGLVTESHEMMKTLYNVVLNNTKSTTPTQSEEYIR